MENHTRLETLSVHRGSKVYLWNTSS